MCSVSQILNRPDLQVEAQRKIAGADGAGDGLPCCGAATHAVRFYCVDCGSVYLSGHHTADARLAPAAASISSKTTTPLRATTQSSSGACRTVRRLVVKNSREDTEEVKYCRSSDSAQWQVEH